ncbi:MAG: hypothetical protein RKL24_01335 [Defluviicoccus sp.]|nr:hypothetical protein [Defluviicoccus sp.]
MRFDIYGRFELELVREQDRWVAYRRAGGVRYRDHDVVLPPELEEQDVIGFLDDLFHELAGPGQSVRRLDATSGRQS